MVVFRTRPSGARVSDSCRMKKARLLVLAIALTAGAGVAFMVAGLKPGTVRQVIRTPVILPTDDVLVAARDIAFGSVIDTRDMRWQNWPQNGVPPGVIRRAVMPDAIAELKGSLPRNDVGPGEPLYQERLIQPGKASFMAAILPAGTRAVAINIDSGGATTAGGFILPNDHVDVIHTFRDDQAARAGGDGAVSE